MTTLQSTGSMIFQPCRDPKTRHLRSVPCGEDLEYGEDLDYWDNRTPMSVGLTAPALRQAVTMFSGVLDGIGMNVRVSVVKGFDGQMGVLGPTPWLELPFSFIGVTGTIDSVDEMSDVVTAFEHARSELGLTQKEMFAATGIKKRTFHSWKRRPADSRPRVASQGQFWRLVDAVEDLRDIVDQPLARWIRGDRRRIDALLAGDFDDVVELAIDRSVHPRRSVGTSVYAGIAEDIDIPIVGSGKINIEDVEDGI